MKFSSVKFLIGAMCLFLAIGSCKAPYFTIGMSEQEFLKHNRVSLVEASTNYTVYKKVNQPFGAPPVIKFFYFRNGKLVEMNEGQRTPDIIVEKRTSNN